MNVEMIILKKYILHEMNGNAVLRDFKWFSQLFLLGVSGDFYQ